jgi:hypothetical protein
MDQTNESVAHLRPVQSSTSYLLPRARQLASRISIPLGELRHTRLPKAHLAKMVQGRTSNRIRGTFLFGGDFNRAYRWVIYVGSEVDLDFALRRGFNVLEGFDEGLGAGFPENIKSFQKNRSVTRDIKHTAAHASDAAILDTKPMLHKVQSQSVSAARCHGHYIMEMPKTMPFVKSAIGDFG